MTNPIKLAISTCPNDTFAFHGILAGLVDTRGLQFDVQLMDIQELNDGIERGKFDVAKASFHAALRWTDRMVVMPSGAALGFGVGPLLLSAAENQRPTDGSQVTLCPGKDTTATLLFKLFYPETTQVQQVVFSEIMPRLQQHQADFGVCIHEGRFTWQSAGLSLVEDLGQRWEGETKCPLPLGGILASRALGRDVLARVQSAIHQSLVLALADPAQALPTMRRYAQEFDDAVLMQHVQLYVNDWTLELGEVGASALKQLSRLAREVGAIDADLPELEIWSPK